MVDRAVGRAQQFRTQCRAIHDQASMVTRLEEQVAALKKTLAELEPAVVKAVAAAKVGKP